MQPDLLTTRQLNRATLDRQLLLERQRLPAIEVIHQLVGLQAQNPRDPYLALWSRLDGFRPGELERLLVERDVVRLVVQRATVHAVTADDCLVLRPLAQPVLTQQLYSHRDFRGCFDGVDLDAVMSYAGERLAEQPRSSRQLKAMFAERFPEHDAAAMAFACRNLLALVQVPPRGLWSASSEVVGTTAEAWLGRPLDPQPPVDEVIRRYLAAFGPATVRDAATWSRYTGLGEVFERLRPGLRTFRDEDGREYFDVPGGCRPDPDVPAPVRLLPEYDNVLLAHADRRRFVSEQIRESMRYDRVGSVGNVLVDGRLVACWRSNAARTRGAREGGDADLTVLSPTPLETPVRDAVEAEAVELAHWIAPGSEPDVRFELLA